MQIPTLGKVPNPSSDERLTIKASPSGITFLKSAYFKTRYTGNKANAVDLDGNLWLDADELRAAIRKDAGDKPRRRSKKLGLVDTRPAEIRIADQIYDDILTSPDKTGKKIREYRVNKKEVRQRILAFINTKQGKKELYFWTVTFPKGTPDDLIYQIYNIWLTRLRQYRMLRAYLWVAERQENGTVHFHIAIPHKMNVHKANAMMAGTLKTFARDGKLPYSVHACKRYNGVDIAKNRNTKRVTNFAIKKGNRALSTYLTKYVTKNDAPFSHLAWHNSREFSSLFLGLTFTWGEFEAYGWELQLDHFGGFDSDFFYFAPWRANAPPVIETHLYEVNSYVYSLLNKES